MPETTVYKNDLLAPWQNDVGLSWKIRPVQTETVAHCMEQSADCQLRAGVSAFDRAHDAAAVLYRLFHRFSSILRLGSVSISSTTSL